MGLDEEEELRRGTGVASCGMEQGRLGPQGARGGGPGAVNEVRVLRGDEVHIPPHLSKEQDIALSAGDRVEVRTPGGGGYGDPASRDAQAVAEDVRLGRYTAQEARRLFEGQPHPDWSEDPPDG